MDPFGFATIVGLLETFQSGIKAKSQRHLASFEQG